MRKAKAKATIRGLWVPRCACLRRDSLVDGGDDGCSICMAFSDIELALLVVFRRIYSLIYLTRSPDFRVLLGYNEMEGQGRGLYSYQGQRRWRHLNIGG